MSLGHLLQRIRACRECEPDLPCGARPVVQASVTAPLLIAGQAPGRQQLLHELPQVQLTLAIGKYAIDWHLARLKAGPRYKTLTETVAHWQEYWPHVLPMPHPSPRNNLWLKRNPWFERDVIPILQERVKTLLTD